MPPSSTRMQERLWWSFMQTSRWWSLPMRLRWRSRSPIISSGLSKEHGNAVWRDLERGVTAVRGSGMTLPTVTPARSHKIICLRKGRVLCATRMSRRTSGLQIYLAARDEQQQMVYHKTQNMIVLLKLIHSSSNFVLQSSATPKVNKSLSGNCSLLCKQIG